MLRADRWKEVHVTHKRLTMLLLTLLIVAGAPLVTACNTTAGAGKDLSAAGKAIESGADKDKGY